MNNKYKKLLSDTGLLALGNIGTKFILFFMVPLYTNFLSTTEYGIADLVTTSTSLLLPFITLSINDALLRFCLEKNANTEKVLWQSTYVLIFSSVVLIFISPILKKINVFGEYYYYFIAITIIQSYRTAFSLYLKAINKVKIFAIDSILYTMILCVLNVIFLVFLHKNLSGYFQSQIIAMTISIVFIIFVGKIFKNNIFFNNLPDKKMLLKMLKYSIPLIANAVSWWIINFSDRYMLKILLDESAVGIYAVATKIPSLLTTFTSVFYQAWLISSIIEYENEKDVKFYENVFKVYSIILTIGAACILLILNMFMKIYVGKEFAEAWIYVPILLYASIFSTFANFFMTLYKSAKTNYKEIIATLLGAIINIMINLLLIPLWGIQGACIATLIAEFLMAIYVIFDTRKILKFKINFKNFFGANLIILIQCIITINKFYNYIISVICIICLLICFKKDLMNIVKTVKQNIFKRKKW